jgi:hypothetical protein
MYLCSLIYFDGNAIRQIKDLLYSLILSIIVNQITDFMKLCMNINATGRHHAPALLTSYQG